MVKELSKYMLIRSIIAELVKILEFGNHSNNKKGMKTIFAAYKDGGEEILFFWKIIRDNCGFYGISAKMPKSSKHGNKQNCIKLYIVFNVN